MKAGGKDVVPERGPLNKGRVLIAAGVSIAYVVLMEVLGSFAATFGVFCLLATILHSKQRGRKRRWTTVFAALCVCVAFYVVFARIFNVPFPQGVAF